jgi:hypothetical protein
MRSPWPAILGGLLFGVALAGMLTAHADEVPYIQTPTSVVEAMLAIAEVGPQDYVVDLGSGDGRIVIAAATRHQARGLGIDYDPTLIAESRANAARAGVSDKVEFLHRDIFLADFRQATVVTMYLLPEVNLELRPRILFDSGPAPRGVARLGHGRLRARSPPGGRGARKTIGLRKEARSFSGQCRPGSRVLARTLTAGREPWDDVAALPDLGTVWLRRWGLAAPAAARGHPVLVLERSP